MARTAIDFGSIIKEKDIYGKYKIEYGQKPQVEIENQPIFQIADRHGNTLMSVDANYKVVLSEHLSNQAASLEFWSHVSRYSAKMQKQEENLELRLGAIYAIGALNNIMKEIDQEKLGKESKCLIKKALDKSSQIFGS